MSGPMSPERLDEIREALKGTARRADVADWDLTVYRAVKQRLLEAVNLLDEVHRLRAELAARVQCDDCGAVGEVAVSTDGRRHLTPSGEIGYPVVPIVAEQGESGGAR